MALVETVVADGNAENRAMEKMSERAAARDRETEERVAAIIEAVRRDGDAALKRFGERFDGGFPERVETDAAGLRAAFEATDARFRAVLERAAANIRRYHEHQKTEGFEIRDAGGAVLGQTVRGLDRVGLYVPGGAAAYPSTALMNGIPAKLAGVSELVVTTPPARRAGGDGRTRFEVGSDILAAAHVAGADRLFAVGGAQAVAALAFGTETIPRVDKIVGPGNIYVAVAKRLLFGRVDIDMIAGPSEILVMADARANPAYIAADMLSQAEHDANAAAVLLTVSRAVADAASAEIEKQVASSPRRDILTASLARYGLIVVCRDTREMIDLANRMAPEHLEIMTDDPFDLLPEIRNAGSVFCGAYAPEPLGDYFAGTNHVLPTSGTARFASPLSVYDFVKRMSYTSYTKEALAAVKDDVALFAEREGLTAHANAVRIRYGETEREN